VKRETTSKRLERWASPADELVLCRNHAEVVWERLGDSSWTRVIDEHLQAYREGTGHDLPCGFCEAIMKAKERGSL
jgi:hypothetical protein